MRHALAGLLLFGTVVVNCGGPSSECGAEPWSGRCRLRSATKVHEKEFPVPQVTYQAVYAPQPNATNPSFTPPESAREIHVLAQHEVALREHLERYAEADCHVAPPPHGTCVPGELAVSVPEFDPARAASTDVVVRGCAQIDEASAQDRLAQMTTTTGRELSESMQFDEHSAELSATAQESVARLAETLAKDPSVECVAIVGEISYGERITTAMERASKVLRLLIERGVDSSRLTTIVPTSPLSATGETEKSVDPAERRVRTRVLLRRQ
jgi:outer membrane protein OmpA-like peptidoglycan-associated protein